MTELVAKLYLDEDVSVEVAKLLRAGQCDALTTAGAKRLGASDRDQLEFSTSEGRVLVTHNRRDFEKLARIRFETGMSHGGLIIAVRRPPRLMADRILQILNQFSSDENGRPDRLYLIISPPSASWREEQNPSSEGGPQL